MIVDLNKRWMDENNMACVTKEPEMFFIDISTGTLANPGRKIQAKWDRAKAVCATCPVMQECARDNLGEVEGVWGGLDPTQRVELRVRHANNVRRLTGALKVEYAKLAHDLRQKSRYSYAEIGRIMGLPYPTTQYLEEWYFGWLAENPEPVKTKPGKVTDVELPLADVLEIKLEFPENPPASGADAWIKYGRRVVHGNYLGQTEDDAWYYFKIKLLGPEYSVCWIKAEDVKLCRDVTRNVLKRVGNGSRIYGSTSKSKGDRRAAEAG